MSSTKTEAPRAWEKSEQQRLKEFGYVMSIALLLISAWLLWKGSVFVLATVGLAVPFFTLAVFAPTALRGIEYWWMLLAEKMSIVVTFLLVSLTFYLMITPLGFCMRLFGADLLKTRLEPKRETYWEPIEEDGPSTRHYLPY